MGAQELKDGQMGYGPSGWFLGRPDGMGSSQIDSKAVVCPVDMMGVVVVVDMNE